MVAGFQFWLLSILFIRQIRARVDTPTVDIETPYGLITGIVEEDTYVFRGVPFAERPKRWEAPVPIEKFPDQPYLATADRDGCPQSCGQPAPACPKSLSEDCLFVTIRTPLPSKAELHPVMVWFHGGQFVGGAGSVVLYDARYAAHHSNTIVVGVNYRLGSWGYLRYDKAGIYGNQGFFDQIEALHFVKKIIGSFGGDANKITVFGQSAGATSIAAMLCSPLAKGLFQRVIQESNPVGLSLQTVNSSNEVAARFISHSVCANAPDSEIRSCMDKMTFPELMDAQNKLQADIDYSNIIAMFYLFTPVADGQNVTGQPLVELTNGNVLDVEHIAGHTHDEGVLYAFAIVGEVMSKAFYETMAQILFPQLPVLELYPSSTCPLVDGVIDCRYTFARVITDYIWICPTRKWMRGLIQKQKVVPYNYIYDHVWSFSEMWGGSKGCYDKACHGGELPFVHNTCFNYKNPDINATCTPDEWRLAVRMSEAWNNFARTGDPNVGLNTLDRTSWPSFEEKDDRYLRFHTNGTNVEDDVRTRFCDKFDKAGYHPEPPVSKQRTVLANSLRAVKQFLLLPPYDHERKIVNSAAIVESIRSGKYGSLKACSQRRDCTLSEVIHAINDQPGID